MKFYEPILAKIKTFFGMEADATDAEVDAKLDAVQSREAYEAKIREEVKAEYEAQMTQLQQELTAAKSHIAELEGTVAKQTTLIAELEAQPAADHTTGKTETEPAEAAATTWNKHPFNERAKAQLSGKG